MKKLLIILFTSILALSSFAQTDSLKQAAKLDSLYFSEMMSRRKVDEFTDEIRIDCPTLGNPLSTINISKQIIIGKTNYYLTLMMRDIVYQSNCKGVIILFTDGTKLNKPEEKIYAEISDISHLYADFRAKYTYQYLTTIQLTPSDLKILGSKIIKKFRLFMFDAEVNKTDADQFRIYSKNIGLTK